MLSRDAFSAKDKNFQALLLSCALVQVVYSNVSAQYYSAYAGDEPSQYTLRVLYGIEQLGIDASSQASQADNNTILWTGPTLLNLTASANVTGKSLLMATLIPYAGAACWQLQTLVAQLSIHLSKHNCQMLEHDALLCIEGADNGSHAATAKQTFI